LSKTEAIRRLAYLTAKDPRVNLGSFLLTEFFAGALTKP